MSEMTAAISISTRPPSKSPSAVSHRRPKTRDVSSRYLETTSSSSLFQSSPSPTAKRCQSPIKNRPATPSSVTNRPQSRGRLDRRGGGGEVSAAERMLLAYGRGLFASFSGNEKRSKLNSSPITPRRGGTPEKRKTTSTSTTTTRSGVAQQEKPKLSEQWPRSLKPSCLSRSLDFTDARKKPSRYCNGPHQNSPTVRSYSMISVDAPRCEKIRPASPSRFGMAPASSGPRGASIARGVSSSRGISPSDRMMSPLRVRSSLSNLVLNFAVDAKKEKIRENGDAHLLRLLHNRLLQWRFANARANAVVSAQKMRAEKRLCNPWTSISKLYYSVRTKRIEMQQLKQNLKLISILNRQMAHLEEWFVVDRDYMSSLVGAAEALKGSTLCLPVDCAAMVNLQSVKDAICSAVDVIQAMAYSISLLLPKVGKISCLAEELNRVNVKEKGMLDVCRDILNTISAL